MGASPTLLPRQDFCPAPASPMSECEKPAVRSKSLGMFDACPKTQHPTAIPLQATPATPTTVANLLAKAHLRWLKCQELVELFNYCLQNKFPFSGAAAVTPPSGCIFLYDRKSVRFFRLDGHNWRKKNDGKTVRETHEKLKMDNIDTLNCYYAHALDPPDLQRRCYWLLDNDNYVLVHYLDAGGNAGRRTVQNWHRSQLQEESSYMSGMTLNNKPTPTPMNNPHPSNMSQSLSSHGTGIAQRVPNMVPHPLGILMGHSAEQQQQQRRPSTMDDACSLPAYNRLEVLQAANHVRPMVAPNMMQWPGGAIVMDPTRSAWVANAEAYGASPPTVMGSSSHGWPWDTVTGLPATWDMQHGLSITPASQAPPPTRPATKPVTSEGVTDCTKLSTPPAAKAVHAPELSPTRTSQSTLCEPQGHTLSGDAAMSSQEPKSNLPQATASHQQSRTQISQPEPPTVSPRRSLDEEAYRFCIWEISTESVDTGGGQKVLIVGSSSGNVDTSRPVYVDVGDIRHEAKFIQKGVISFITKPSPPGLAKLRVVNEHGEEVSGTASLRYQAPRNNFPGFRAQFQNDRDAQIDMILRMFNTGTGARGMPFR